MAKMLRNLYKDFSIGGDKMGRKNILKLTHKDMDENVREICKVMGYLHYHTHDSRRSQPGFPDWLIIKEDTLVFVELKCGKDKLNEDQIKWFVALRRLRRCEAYVVRDQEGLDVLMEFLASKWYQDKIFMDNMSKLKEMTDKELGQAANL